MTSSAATDRWSLWPLRLFLGITFTFAGLQKLANPSYLNAHSPTSVQATILSLRHQSPIGFLLGWSSHAPVLVGVLIAVGELAVGLSTLIGLWVRLTALGGFLLALTFFLTVSFHTRPYYYGSDIVFMFAWSVPLIAGKWPDPTLDSVLRRRAVQTTDPHRRQLVLGGAGAVGLAVFTGALAGVTAAVGRALHVAPAAARRPLPGGPAPGTTPQTQQTHGSRASRLPGTPIVDASRLPVGNAMHFTDQQGAPAWLIHESDGSFRAFSAVCTHAGCTVDISGGEFVCPCHGGSYSVTSGAVLGGPPPSPLPELQVRVVDGSVRLL